MNKKKILYVISSPDMSSFATGFMDAVSLSPAIDPYVIIFIEFYDQRNKEDIIIDFNLLSIDYKKVEIIQYSKSKLGIHVFQRKYVNFISSFSKLHQLSIVHFLTQDTFIAFNLSVFKEMKVYYTVHDLEHHAAKLSILGHLKRYFLLTMKDKRIIRNVSNLVTSSEHQLESLKKIYPKKNIYQHNMPSLITPGIRKGNVKVKELSGLEDYVLFFGRIEFYKGIELLYKSFIENENLKDVPLVIAGKGNVYFDRDINKESNIFIINRFISDEEMGDLFSKAKIVVLPYTSATQSAVTSLSYYFKKPMIVSNIEGLRDSIIDQKTALLFNPKLEKDLDSKITLLLEDHNLYNEICLNQIEYEDFFYGLSKLTSDIESIYN